MKKAIAAVVINAMMIGSVSVAGAQYIKEDQAELEFQQLLNTDTKAEALECLALNIYFETRAVSMADAMAVSDVVLNRVYSSRYPDSICAVVKQGVQKPSWKDPEVMVMARHKCQFSWYCDGKADVPTDSTAWERSREFAHDFLIHGEYQGLTEGSTHYHASYVKPEWRKQLDRVTRIGSHIFYRRK